MSTGGKTQTTQSGPPKWAQPYFQAHIEQASQQANRPYERFQGDRVAGFNPDQLVGQQMVRDRAFAGNQGVDDASGYLRSVINGRGSNPYLQQQIDAMSGDMTSNFQNGTQANMLSQFQQGGAFGGSAHQQALQGAQSALAQQLGRASGDMRFNDWQAGQDRAMQASLAMPGFNQGAYNDANAMLGIGGQTQGLMQAGMDSQYGDYREARDWGANNLGLMGNALGRVTGGNVTSPNPNYQSPWQTAAGLAAAYYGSSNGGGG